MLEKLLGGKGLVAMQVGSVKGGWGRLPDLCEC